MDLRQSKKFAQYLKTRGWIVEKIDSDFVYIRKFPLTPFSILKFQRSSNLNFRKIDQLAKKYRSISVYLEPVKEPETSNQELKKHGYRLSKSPFLPTKTIQLKLTLSEAKILAQMKKDTRYAIRKALLAGPTCQQVGPEQTKLFHQAWKKSVNWQRHVPSLKSLNQLKMAFGPQAVFLTISHYDTAQYHSGITVGTIILIAGKSAYYYYAFTSKEGRKTLAQYLLIWEAIKMAKKKKCRIFNFEGIYDQRFPIKAWRGFSHFKKSFGGKEVEYPGCFAKHRLFVR